MPEVMQCGKVADEVECAKALKDSDSSSDDEDGENKSSQAKRDARRVRACARRAAENRARQKRHLALVRKTRTARTAPDR